MVTMFENNEEVAKGQSYTTGMVHLAVAKGPEGQLKQACGMMRKGLAFLAKVPDNTEITCKRCNSL
jgi:hypothetical protein